MGRSRQESTSVNEIRDLVTRKRARRVGWCDTIIIVPVTWDLDIPDFVDLLCTLDVTEDEVGVRLNPGPIDVGTWCDFCVGGRRFTELCSSANRNGCLRT